MFKKSFTLIEMMISISLFTLVLLFLYQSFDMTKKSNEFYALKLDSLKSNNDFKKLLTSDFFNIIDNKSIKIQRDKEDNTILGFQSNNAFHNSFYINITYFLSKDNELLRLESKEVFDKNNIYKFVDNTYVDILKTEVKKFRVIKIKNKDKNLFESYALYIEYNNGNNMYLSLMSL
jgi:hypothetical protein